MNLISPASEVAAVGRGLVRLPWPALLGPLSLSDAEALDELARLRSVPDGRFVFERGTVARSVVGLVEGQVACGWTQPPRGLSAERVLHGPAWLALAGPLSEGRHHYDAQAQSAVQVVEIPVEALRSLAASHPMLGLRLVDALAREVGRLDARVHELMHKDAGARLAAWLYAQIEGRAQAVLRLAERKRDIASQLGMTPETLSRMMRALSERGLIEVNGYTVRVLDAPGLQGLAGA